MSDYLIKSLVHDGQLRAYAIDATQTVSTAQQYHDTWQSSSAALGRTLIGTLLLSAASLSGDETLAVNINGGGPVGKIIAEGNANGTVRGSIQAPHVKLTLNKNNKIDVKNAVGTNGFMTVTKDLGLKEPFTGQVPLVSGELGEDFTYYLAASEQIPSAVALSVFVNNDNSIAAAGGFLLQVLPDATEEVIADLEKRLEELPLVSEMMLKGKKPEDILDVLFGAENVKILDKMDIKYECKCSKEHFAELMATLPKKDLEELIAKDQGAEAVCHFCNKKYQFDEAELTAILEHSYDK
ncbi:Hsp33 family molecular chaperone HslO [Ligilactobacillus ceti]|uniref:33 kDa chaperonin n=1 Tax=Ligilactobacillus ceti DSM 22408 TaxID=1122146 RepID=A0A0R2KSS3_9LACO|nr:Hsp33 family molecular chaperone HslO [Ligilactobacillus ceti]KRN89261.1 heat shock protein Hsp33 [Ligilactobacillus ceti DSM 22408]